MAKLAWRVKLVAKRHPGVTTKTELACIEHDADVGLTELGLRLDEVKRPARPGRSARCRPGVSSTAPGLRRQNRCSG